MLDTHHTDAGAWDTDPRYVGPERRAAQAPLWSLLMATLDELDFGLLLLVDTSRVLHANHVARLELNTQHPLQLLGDQLRVRRGEDVVALRRALDDAATRGLRHLLTVGHDVEATTLAIVPIGRASRSGTAATLVLFSKRQMCQQLSLQWFARAHELTPAEAEVLKGLCDGEPPREIAKRQSVAISTVRSQISAVRSKTRAPSIRALVRQVALLPPLVGALRSSMPDHAR